MNKEAIENMQHINVTLIAENKELRKQLKKAREGKTLYLVKEWFYDMAGKLKVKESWASHDEVVG